MNSSQKALIATGVVAAGAAVALLAKFVQRYRLGRAVYSSKWFSEFGSMWEGQAMSIEIEDCLLDMKSEFQHIQVFNTKTYGRMLVLDGVIQVTERDEFAYQEMMVHPAIYAHPNPKKVLVIGGGDGGCIRELARHKGIEVIHQCELDEQVIVASKKFIPSVAEGYKDPRVTTFIQCGYQFMIDRKNEYDVVIVDSSDPVGPAEALFKEPFYTAVSEALRENGIASTQGECMWLHTDTIRTVIDFSKAHFADIAYAQISIPTYPSGTIGALILAKTKGVDIRNPIRQPTAEEEKNLQYYSNEVHKASMVLPNFVKRAIKAE